MTQKEIEDIGIKAGLTQGSDHMQVFTQYIIARNFDQHHISTAQKWAKRFADNREFEHSDSVGQRILLLMRPNKYLNKVIS